MANNGLANAIRDLLRDLPYFILDLLPVLQNLFWNVLVPVVVVVGAVLGGIRLFFWLLRIVFPPSAQELHREALEMHKRGGDTVRNRKRVKDLLESSLQRDASFLPSYLTLIALHLFREKNHYAALATIERGRSQFGNKNKKLESLHLDAKAMESNLGHMVLAGSFTNTYLGDYTYQAVVEDSSASLSLTNRSKLKHN